MGQPPQRERSGAEPTDQGPANRAERVERIIVGVVTSPLHVTNRILAAVLRRIEARRKLARTQPKGGSGT